MRISKVHIENFRSIKKLDFSPGPYCVLIGENNSGKSNILRAINLILGETWPSERNFTEEDFHNQDTNNDIVIQAFFDVAITEKRFGVEVTIGGFELRCKAYKIRVKKKPAGSLSTDYMCLKPNGEQVRVPSAPFRSGEKPKFIPMRVSGALREQAPSIIYIGVLREYDKQTPGSRWSILRRLFNEVNAEFLSDKKKIKIPQSDGTVKEMTRKEAFEATVKDAYKYLRTDTFNEIEKRLSENAIEQMGLDSGENKVELHFESHDPTNAFKSLQLYIDQLGIRSPAGDVGAGLQSAIVVAIFRTYEELKKEGAIVAIEEPEVFLHPQKARYFSTVLRSLAEKGNQLFLTTHSPVFVQIHDSESAALVRRSEKDGTRVFQASKVELAADERKALRLMSEFDAQRNELFFARRLMFVEGNTEKMAMPLVFKALGVDINKENISVIECGGKTKIPLFARVANAFNLPYVILMDHDIRDIEEDWSEKRQEEQKKKNKDHCRWNKNILSEAGDDKVFFMVPDFERELGLSGDDSLKVDQGFAMFEHAEERNIPECLRKPIKKLLA